MPEFITQFFESILYQPIFNVFVALYNVVPDVGVVIFILTVTLRLAIYPLTKKQIKSQESMKEIQPKLKKIKKEYDDQQKVAQKTMELYNEHDVNPLGSCLPILIQIPIFIALYWVLKNGVGTSQFNLLYSFVSAPAEINPISFGYVNLAKSGNWILAGMAAASQYWQMKSMRSGQDGMNMGMNSASQENSDEEEEKSMQKEMMNSMGSMMKFMPIITFFIGISLPGGVALYWFLSTFTMAVQHKLLRNDNNNSDDEDDKDNKTDSSTGSNSSSLSSQEDDEVIEGEVVD